MQALPRHVTDRGIRMPCVDGMLRAIDAGLKTETRRPVKYKANGQPQKCLYGKTGDYLLVTGSHILVDADGNLSTGREDRARAIYRVDYDGDADAVEWRPPMFQPKWSPTRVVVNTGINIEPLTEITHRGAISEGISLIRYPNAVGYHWVPTADESDSYPTPIAAYEALWDSIHKDRGLMFDTNPNVWVVKFEIVDAAAL